MLRGSLNTVPVTLIFAAIILSSIFFLAQGAKSELAPQEDQGAVILSATSAPNATMQQRAMWDLHLNALILQIPEVAHTFQIDVPGTEIIGGGAEALGSAHPNGQCAADGHAEYCE